MINPHYVLLEGPIAARLLRWACERSFLSKAQHATCRVQYKYQRMERSGMPGKSSLVRTTVLPQKHGRIHVFDEQKTDTKGARDQVSPQCDTDPQNGETLTAILPPEIFIHIFNFLERNSVDIDVVTLVCGRWRTIALQIPYLWTKIIVDLTNLDKKQSKKLLARVEVLLDRTGSLRLDVEWHASGKSKLDSLFYTLFKQKGTFNRWRTLTIDLDHTTLLPVGEIREADKFSSIEYLKLVSNPPLAFLDIISTTATHKLHTLELGSKFRCPPDFLAGYGGILMLIGTLHIWNRVILPPVVIPSNVIKLQAYTPPRIPMPHVQHLFLKKLSLESFHTFQPENLVTLMINVSIKRAPAGFTITLPRLEWLGLRGTACCNVDAFKLPSLHTLSFKWEEQEAQSLDDSFVTGLRNGFEAPKLLLLFLNVYLGPQSTQDILGHFPQISRADLSFRDAAHGQVILSHVFPNRRDFDFCPNLDFLRVTLRSPPPDVIEWKQVIRKTARNIGEPFWKLESKWPDGRYSKFIAKETRQRVACIYPWHSE